MDRKDSPARRGLQSYEAYRSRQDISPLRRPTSTAPLSPSPSPSRVPSSRSPTRSTTSISPSRVKNQVTFDVPYRAKVIVHHFRSSFLIHIRTFGIHLFAGTIVAVIQAVLRELCLLTNFDIQP